MRRAAPPRPRADLAERIIHAALSAAQVKPSARLWDDFMAMFMVPHPSVAVAAGVFIGLALGIEASDGLTILQQDWSSFLYVNEGGWL